MAIDGSVTAWSDGRPVLARQVSSASSAGLATWSDGRPLAMALSVANLTVSVHDDVSVIDIGGRFNTFTSSRFDALAVTEQVRAILSPARQVHESISVADTAHHGVPLTRAVSEAISVAENLTHAQLLQVECDESISVVDVLRIVSELRRSVFERIRLADGAFLQPNPIAVLVFESISARDASLFPGPTGSGTVSPNQPNTDADYTDYWTTGP